MKNVLLSGRIKCVGYAYPSEDRVEETLGAQGIAVVSPDAKATRLLTTRKLQVFGFSKDGADVFGIERDTTGKAAQGQLYEVNVATGVDISVSEIALLVLEAVGNPAATTVHVDERPGQVDRHIGSTVKLEQLTGWRASIAFDDGLERTVAWYRENEAWWRGVLGRVGVSSS